MAALDRLADHRLDREPRANPDARRNKVLWVDRVEFMNPPHGQRWALYASHLGSYMRRWIFRFAGRTLRIHNILESDAGRDFHDHPFDFTSLILKGGYLEHRPGCICGTFFDDCGEDSPCWFYGPGSIVRRRATDLHRLEITDGPAWTLVLTSQYKRNWGFLTPRGWVRFQDYERSFYRES